MHRSLLTTLACAVSLTAVTAAHATPPGFGGAANPHGGGSPHAAGSPHGGGSPHGSGSPHGGMGMGHAAMRGESDPKARSVQHWWPDQVDLSELRKNRYTANPHGDDFDYAAEFAKLDLEQVKGEVARVLTSSQDWWPADYGSYAGLFIRLAWHSAGTYRSGDGRGGSDGGQLRFEPLNSWPDNGNLDKARRLLWPVKQKYGKSLSWADLMVLAGNVALEQSGFKTYAFAGGRADNWQPELVYWGAERKFLDSDVRYKDGELEEPLGASQLALIYVNPEGPEGNPEILKSAQQIRTTFGRMGMNDEETVALIVGGHTLGKAHGARKADECVGPEPAAEGVDEQGLGWKNSCGTGAGADATTSGLEGAWTATPVNWSNNYVENLYAFEWKLSESPNGAKQWVPENEEEVRFVPDAHVPGKFHAPIMFTTDLALRYDPEYGKITQRWLENPGQMDDAFARAWFKLTHRDMGPSTRYVGAEAPSEALVWQDPVPKADYAMVTDADIDRLKRSIFASGLSNSELVRAAWASASTYRETDYRGGANGARVRLAPQNGWEVNSPDELGRVLLVLEDIQADFNARNTGGRKVSVADLIVIGGNAAIERAAQQAGHSISVPFTPGRTDASAQMTDEASINLLKPAADGFRNYYSERARLSPADMLIDKADTLTLTVPEMTALVGGLRALNANVGAVQHGVLTGSPETLTNDFFVNLLDMSTEWKPVDGEEGVFEGLDRQTGERKWTATEVDLVFGSNSELRAVAETYAFDGAEKTFAEDFVKAWVKVMELDRFDVK